MQKRWWRLELMSLANAFYHTKKLEKVALMAVNA
jgi:hypothetical protein